jgi:large subunit ribosomal protein L5
MPEEKKENQISAEGKTLTKKKKEKPPKAEGKAEGEAKVEAKEKPKKEKRPVPPRQHTALEVLYFNKCVDALKEKFGYKNRMQVPKLEKIIINTSVKEALQDIKVLENAADEIAAITGQRPVLTRAKKSIANFKLRTGAKIGARVTLRGGRMYEFMNRLVNVALPRVRDFKGVSPKSFDGRGNYTLGLTEQSLFPEINFDKIQRVNGMNVTFVTTAKNDEEGRELLKLLGMPFRT